MMEIVGEMCSSVADQSAVAPLAVEASMSVNSALEGAVTPIPGGLIVLAIAPVNAENAEIDPAVTVRTPSLKAIA
jgi:formylmethanofuran:tetrahydromethanopterin formyltransferase